MRIKGESFNMKHILGSESRSTLTNVQEGDCQPNAVDLRLDKIFRILPNLFEITNETKKHRGSEEIFPDDNGFFNLEVGSYEVVMENIIKVGKDEAGWTITRSTLNRNGVFITSGLYDAGYNGVMAGCMHVNVGPMRVKKGTRVAQYLSFDSESLHEYNGSYGLKSDHDKKYV
jgi:deoxycytidine triphosphate deaminase